MSTKVFKYIIDFQADAQKFGKQVGGMNGMLKGAAIAAGALFAADKIMDAAKAVGDYALEISNVKNQVQQLTGLQGAAADQMAGGAQAIAQAYQQEVSEAVKTANVLMHQFGESSQTSFNLLNAGLATAANANGDFLKQVQEYSTHFREAGLDATQMYAIIAQGNKMGVFDDKTADTIKEGSIRLREMTKTTREALDGIGLSSTQIQRDISSGATSMFGVMQDVSRQLDKLPEQSPAVGAALADIFGGPGEDAVEFVRALGDIDTSMETLLGDLTEAEKAQMAFTEELQEFHTIGAQVFGGTGTMVTKLKTFFMGFVNDAIRGVVSFINYFIDLYNESMVFRAGIEYIKFTVKTSFEFIGLVFKQFWNQLKTVGKLLKAVFTADFKAIPGILSETFQTSVNNAKTFGESFSNRFKDGVQNVLNPREKVALISLSTDAEPAGLEDGINYAKGFATGYAGHGKTAVPDVIDTRGGSALSVSLGEKELKAFERAKTELQGINELIGENISLMPEMNMGWTSFLDTMYAIADKRAELDDGLTQLQQAGLGFAETMMQSAMSADNNLQNLGQTIKQTAADAIRAYIAEGVAGAVSKSLAFLPFPFNMAAGAMAAAAATSLFNSIIPAFASGAIVSGPTLAMVGEYPGASSDPEVISPLSKLKGIMGNQASRERIIIPTTRIRKGDIYISYHEAENELLKRT